MKLFVYTLGCRVNQCETEAIAQSFASHGNEILKNCRDAELIIINTCTVTSKAEQKARRMIRLFAQVCTTIVTGCYADKNLESISRNIVVLPLSRKPDLLNLPLFITEHQGYSLNEIVRMFATERINRNFSVFDYAATGFSYHCRSYLKIQDGCDNNCGFCRVHIARGPSSFLEPEIAVQRAIEIEKAGYHEIVLAGVNLTMYDHRGDGLGGLLEKLLAKLGSDVRIRLSSLEPDHIDDRLLETLKDSRMQPYFHIPIQSASDKVIKRINRHYDSSHLEYVIEKVRSIKDDPLIACDVITGLPAEGEEEFEFSRAFLEKHFSLMHVFPFSPRPETALYDAKDKVPESVRDLRAKILRDLSSKLYLDYVNRQIGRDNEVILEDYKSGKWYGLSGNYIRFEVRNVPYCAKCGDIFKVKVITSETAECL